MTRKFPNRPGVRLLELVCASVIVLASSALGLASTTSDVPLLVSEPDSTRALVFNPAEPKRGGGQLPSGAPVVLVPGDQTRAVLFAANLDLLPGEGANAFRADALDGFGRRYELTVEEISPVPGREWVYAVQVKLDGRIGDVGDVLVRLNLHGVASNRVRLAIGHLGDGPQYDAGAKPTPMPQKPPEPQEPGEEERVGAPYSGDRMRFMAQATFGPTGTLDARLRRISFQTWIFEQLQTPYPSTPYPNLPLMPTDANVGCPTTMPAAERTACLRDNYSMYLLQNWFYKDALYGQAQLRRRVAWALSQILVVSGRDTQQPSHMLHYLKILDRNAFGNYRQLLQEITLNPAMGNYLDMVRSTRTNPNENYAREILQLFSVGLDKLNPDGTPIIVNNERVPTYDQDVVNGFTKVFTGWTFCNVAGATCPNAAAGFVNYIDPMRLVTGNHDTTSKELLDGVMLPAIVVGQDPVAYANNELTAALDNIFFHPNVGPFVSKQLIQHLVTSNPTPAYVGRVAAVFNNNGYGLRGDMYSVIRAILLDPEARGNAKTDPNYGYLKEPVLLATMLMRSFDVRAASGVAGTQSDGYINPQTVALDQDVFRPPTVFNYYPPDYVIPGSNDLLGPEFFIMTTGTALRRANLVNTMVFSNIPAGTGQFPNAPVGTAINFDGVVAQAGDPATMIESLNRQMLNGTMSQSARNIITTAVNVVPATNARLRAQTAIYLIATSSQYQVQR